MPEFRDSAAATVGADAMTAARPRCVFWIWSSAPPPDLHKIRVACFGAACWGFQGHHWCGVCIAQLKIINQGSLQAELEGGRHHYSTPFAKALQTMRRVSCRRTNLSQTIAIFRTHSFTIFSRPTPSKHDARSPESASSSGISQPPSDLRRHGTHTQRRVKSHPVCDAAGGAASSHSSA